MRLHDLRGVGSRGMAPVHHQSRRGHCCRGTHPRTAGSREASRNGPPICIGGTRMTDNAARRTTQIPVFTLANGHDVVLHVHEVKGSQAGPTVGLIAGVHGDEPLSIEIVRRIVVETDPSTLRGSILAISVANPYAIQAL